MNRIVVSLLSATALVQSQAADIIWVSFHPPNGTASANATTAGFTQAPDIGYTQLLQGSGHVVTRVVTSGTPNTALLNAADLVIISRSVPSGDYELDAETAAWNGITAPMMILGGYVIRNVRLGYTNGGTIPDTNATISLNVLAPTHPVFSGVTLDGSNNTPAYANIQTFNGINQRGISVNTDALAGGGTLLATVAAPNTPTGGMIIGEWQAGSMMGTTPPDTLGGHRMVFLTGSRENDGLTSEGAGIFDLAPAGQQMFLNAVNYMAIPEPSTAVLLALATGALALRRRRV